MHNRFEIKGFLGPVSRFDSLYPSEWVALLTTYSVLLHKSSNAQEACIIVHEEPGVRVGNQALGALPLLNKETPTHAGLGDKVSNFDVNLGTSTFRVTVRSVRVCWFSSLEQTQQ